MSKHPEIWIEKAKYDLDTAKAMLDSGRHLYVFFCCQQALEKTLKGIIAKRSGDFPPRIHNLALLCEKAGVEAGVHLEFFRKLGFYYVQSRYPEEVDLVGKNDVGQNAGEYYNKTVEVFGWLLSQAR